MRISDRLVVQQVDDRLVFVDDSSGDEHVMPILEVPILARRIQAAWVDRAPGLDLNGVAVFPAEIPGLSFALGYFWRGRIHGE